MVGLVVNIVPLRTVCIVTLTTCLLPFPAAAQDTLEDLIEAAAEEEESVDLEQIYDLTADPIDLNEATPHQLASIPILEPSAVAAIINYRTSQGAFRSLADLEQVSGLTASQLRWLQHLTKVRSPEQRQPRARRIRFSSRSRITRRLDVGRGYRGPPEEREYLGSPARVYQRIHMKASLWSAGLTLDKQPGEDFRWEPGAGHPGFDFATGYLSFTSPRKHWSVVLGDYAVDLGQGLGIGARTFTSAGRESTKGIEGGGRGVRATVSTMRDAYLRGLGGHLQIRKRWRASIFSSQRYRDAVIEVEHLSGGIVNPFVFGAVGTPLHRTATERARASTLRERVAGAALQWSRNASNVGVAAYTVRFDPQVRPRDRLDLIPLQRRTGFSVATIHGRLQLGQAATFGEFATVDGSNVAYLVGVDLTTQSEVEVVVLARKYAPGYDNHLATGFGRGSSTRNEEGIYFGLSTPMSNRLMLRLYVDHHMNPWPRFNSPRPTTGTDWMIDLEYRPRSWWIMSAMVRHRVTEASAEASEPQPIRSVDQSSRRATRLDQQIILGGSWTFRLRGDLVSATQPRRDLMRGMLLYQDINWKATDALIFSGRLAFFDSDAFESRVFMFERDLTAAFAMSQFSGRGQRLYGMITWRTNKSALQIKYGITQIEDALSIGSGHDEVMGNRVRELRCQLQLTL